jgi:hypothetical protein
MSIDQSKPDRRETDKKLSQAEYPRDSLADSYSLQQSQQLFDHLKPSDASATRRLGLDKCSKPLNDSHRKERPNSSEQKYYLCEYSFEGNRYSLEIPAGSWKEAECRLRRISYGIVAGEIKATLPVQLGWMAKLVVWLKQDARS